MAFTVKEAKELAQKRFLGGAVIRGEDAIEWVDEFVSLPELALIRELIDEYELVAKEGQWYSLPPDLAYVVNILNSNDNPYRYYSVRAKKIKFATADTYRIEYVPLPNPITRIDQELPLPDTFRHIVGKYLAGHYLVVQKDQGLQQRGMLYFQEAATSIKSQYDFYDFDSNGFTQTIKW